MKINFTCRNPIGYRSLWKSYSFVYIFFAILIILVYYLNRTDIKENQSLNDYDLENSGRMRGKFSPINSKLSRYDRITKINTTATEKKIFYRKSRQSKLCSIAHWRTAYNHSIINENIYVNEKQKLIWCSTLKLEEIPWIKKLEEVESFGFNKFRKYRNVGTSDLKNLLKQSTYATFVLLEDPLARLLSIYKTKIDRSDDSNMELRCSIVKVYIDGRKKPACYPTFEEFIKYVIGHFDNGTDLNKEWMAATKLCSPCMINYQFIIHAEDLKEQRFLNKMILRTNASLIKIRDKEIAEHYYAQLNENIIRRLLYDVYDNDFELFGFNRYTYLKNPSKQR